MPGPICSLHGPVPPAELAFNKECGQIHNVPAGRGHALNGEPCWEEEIPHTDDVQRPGGAAEQRDADAPQVGWRGPMAADIDD
jgi:hypothetical protein